MCCNVTLRSVLREYSCIKRVLTLTFLNVCVCRFNYPARNNNAKYYIAVSVQSIGTNFLMKCASFRATLLNTKYVLSCSENFCMKVHVL